ncbi:MAG: hypothetical protein Q9181_007924 [Wetmoreana brouardii]
MVSAPMVVSPSEAWDGNDGPWSTFALGFGTPPQFVKVLVSTTCSQPWAVDPLGCTATDPPDCASKRGGLFNKNHSSTWQDQGFYELGQQLNLGYTGNGDFGLDSITFGYPGSGAASVNRQLLATIAAKDYYLATWGIAPRPTNLTSSDPDETIFDPGDSHQSLLSTLKQLQKIPSLSYGYTAGARYRLNRVSASLTLGGYDIARFVPSNLTFDLAGDSSLVVGVQSISIVGSSYKLLPTPVPALIDSTVPHIWLPLEACRVFETIFGISWDPTSNLYLVNDTTHQALLAQNASLVFSIGATTLSPNVVNITLPYATFDLQVSDSYPGVKNSTRYFPLRRAANDTQYTLGRTFLQETYVKSVQHLLKKLYTLWLDSVDSMTHRSESLTVYRYLIADYERSSFSINQCHFAEKTPKDIRTILPLNVTNVTTGTTSNSHQKQGGLSSGAIAAIPVASAVFLVVLVTTLTVIWRWIQSSKVSALTQARQQDESLEVVYAANCESEQELHADPKPLPELHAISMGPFEMVDGVAAGEVATGGERWELHG